MPLHFNDLDLRPLVSGTASALIVPCRMCPAITVAVKKKEPFLQVFRHFIRCRPFDRYLENLQSELSKLGTRTEIFKSDLPHQWFMCMWPSAQYRKLEKMLEKYGMLIVLGCDSAMVTAQEAVGSRDCKIIPGLELTGIMNAELRIQFPGTIGFKSRRTVPISQARGQHCRINGCPVD